MKTSITYLSLIFLCISCAQTENQKEEVLIEKPPVDKKVSVASQIEQLKADGYQIFDYVDEKTGDTVIMQQYFMAF